MEKKRIMVNTGESYASSEPAILFTLLGSCVAVCLYDPIARVGGMNHILLPGKPDMNKYDDTARFGINAMELLVTKVMKYGGNRRKLLAKAFGGGQILPELSKTKGVGIRISEFVVDFLNTEKIRLVSHDLGGFNIRNIFFHTDTGDVFLKRTLAKKQQEVIAKEKNYLRYVKREILEPRKREVIIFNGIKNERYKAVNG